MTCIPHAKSGQKIQFDAVVNLECLMAVPYVNGVFFTKLRPLNCRNSRQYSRRVSVVDNSVLFNSSHTFQCKVRINPETNVLESYKLKISVRMESNGGKSFLKIGYVIVNLACFVASDFVRSRRRYLLKGYDEGRRGVGKRLDNSLLVVSFTCQQQFDSTNFRLPPEDLSNCVSTSHSVSAHERAPQKNNECGFLNTAAASAALPLMTEGWNEECVQMRARRRRLEHEAKGSLEGRPASANDEAKATLKEQDSLPTHFLPSSFVKEQISSVGEEEEFIGSTEPERSYETSQPSFIPPAFDHSEQAQRISHQEGQECSSLSSSSSSSSSPSSHEASPGTSPFSTSNVCSVAIGVVPTAIKPRLTHDFSSLPIHSRAFGPTSQIGGGSGGGGDNINGGDSVVGAQFHTCPHMRPSSLLSQHQRTMLSADSGFRLHALPPASSSSSTGVGGESVPIVSVAANERCSLSSGFQSHSRNSSFESAGVSRCVLGDLIPTPTSSSADYRLSVSMIGGSKQHLIDATRAPHDEVVNQILRATIIDHPCASAPTTTAVGGTSTHPLG